MMPLNIEVHEMIPMVNYSWPQSFGHSIKNRKSIVDRGWYILNRVLLFNESIGR